MCDTQQFDYLQHKFIMNLVEGVLKDPNELQELFMADRKLLIKQCIYTNYPSYDPSLNGMNAITARPSVSQGPNNTSFDSVQFLRSLYGPAWSTIESDELSYPTQKHYVPPSGHLPSCVERPSENPYTLPPNRCNYTFRTTSKENSSVQKIPQLADNNSINYNTDAAHTGDYAQLLSAVEQLQNTAPSNNMIQRQTMPFTKNTSNTFNPFHCESTNCNTLSSIETHIDGQVNGLNENRYFKDQSLGQKFLQTDVPYYKKKSEDQPTFCSFCRKNGEP